MREPGQSNPPSTNLTTSLRLIKELQKRFRTMEAEEREKEGAVKQDKLILSNNKGNPKLKDLFVRPNIIAKRISGALEAHINGRKFYYFIKNCNRQRNLRSKIMSLSVLMLLVQLF